MAEATTLPKVVKAEAVVIERLASAADSDTANGSDQILEAEEAEDDGQSVYSRTWSGPDLAHYFVGPRDLDRYSKWPMFLRLEGSILPGLILPLFFIAVWATTIRLISSYVHNLAVNQVLLTVLGFVVALGLSFRSSTAYERYGEGRKYWCQLVLASQALSRMIWIHATEREGELGKEDLLHKMTGLNLIKAFSVALKRKLRWEPFLTHHDLNGLVGHLDTFAKEATVDHVPLNTKISLKRRFGLYLGLPFAKSNPRKQIKRSTKPVGNLPLEILSYLSSYVDSLVENGQLKVPIHQTLAYNNIAAMNDVLTGTDRILRTPMPIAYSIAISQITWVYVIMLPFQLDGTLKWVQIPATVIAAYIILGILLIGQEIENPFGQDVNDLPLDSYCYQIAEDIDVISSRKKPNISELVTHPENKVMFPVSTQGYPTWAEKTEGRLREELKYKATAIFHARKGEAPDATAKPMKTASPNGEECV